MTSAQFDQLFRDQFNSLANLAFSVVKDRDEARDIVQQVFLNIWQNKDHLVFKSSAGAYLYRAVLNTSLTRLSGMKKTIRLEPVNDLKADDGTDESDRVELLEKVQKGICELPAVCQHVFRLSRFSDLSNKEIAEELGISVKAVEKHITKALKYLRSKIVYIAVMVVGLLISFLSSL